MIYSCCSVYRFPPDIVLLHQHEYSATTISAKSRRRRRRRRTFLTLRSNLTEPQRSKVRLGANTFRMMNEVKKMIAIRRQKTKD